MINPLGLYVTNLTWGEVVSMGTDQQSTNTQSGNAQKGNGGSQQ
jgi:hypothetical protein